MKHIVLTIRIFEINENLIIFIFLLDDLILQMYDFFIHQENTVHFTNYMYSNMMRDLLIENSKKNTYKFD